MEFDDDVIMEFDDVINEACKEAAEGKVLEADIEEVPSLLSAFLIEDRSSLSPPSRAGIDKLLSSVSPAQGDKTDDILSLLEALVFGVVSMLQGAKLLSCPRAETSVGEEGDEEALPLSGGAELSLVLSLGATEGCNLTSKCSLKDVVLSVVGVDEAVADGAVLPPPPPLPLEEELLVDLTVEEYPDSDSLCTQVIKKRNKGVGQ